MSFCSHTTCRLFWQLETDQTNSDIETNHQVMILMGSNLCDWICGHYRELRPQLHEFIVSRDSKSRWNGKQQSSNKRINNVSVKNKRTQSNCETVWFRGNVQGISGSLAYFVIIVHISLITFNSVSGTPRRCIGQQRERAIMCVRL